MHLAGGANTNRNGLAFEQLTCMYKNLVDKGYTRVTMNGLGKNSFYLQKTVADKTIVYTTKIGLKHYIFNTFGLVIHKQPDEAYIVHDPLGVRLYIVEKKFQNVCGSVEEKLLACDGIKRMYSNVVGNVMSVHYIFCLSAYFKKMFTDTPSAKSKLVEKIITEYGVEILYGEDPGYLHQLESLIV